MSKRYFCCVADHHIFYDLQQNCTPLVARLKFVGFVTSSTVNKSAINDPRPTTRALRRSDSRAKQYNLRVHRKPEKKNEENFVGNE
jgi:hypothetical protein